MATQADESSPSGPKAATRVLDVLTVLAGKPDGSTLAELSMAVSVPKSTLLRTLRGLSEQSYLSHADGRYRLGSRAYHFASRIVRNWSAPEMIRAQVKALARETKESVGFAIADWELGQVIYTEAVNSTQPVHYALRAGARAPLYASAAGRVLLAYASPAQVDAYLAHATLRKLTSHTRTDPALLRSHLAEIRRKGYCASFGEILNDSAAIAVPVLGSDGDATGALMLAAPLERMRSLHDRYQQAVIRSGQHASGVR